MESIQLLNLSKYAKVFLIITTAISVTAAAGLTVASCKSVNCTTFLIPHKPATILISVINVYVFLIRQNFLDNNKQKAPQLHYKKIYKSFPSFSPCQCLSFGLLHTESLYCYWQTNQRQIIVPVTSAVNCSSLYPCLMYSWQKSRYTHRGSCTFFKSVTYFGGRQGTLIELEVLSVCIKYSTFNFMLHYSRFFPS